MKKKNYKLLAFIGGWLFLALFLWKVDWHLVLKNLYLIGWKFGFVVLITGLAYGMASTAWLLCFSELPKQLNPSKLFIYRQIGETLTTINPANIIVGETAKMYLLKKDGVDYQAGLVSILLSRTLIMLSMIALFSLLPFFFFNADFWPTNSIGNFLLLGVFVLLLFGFFYSMISQKLLLYKWILAFQTRWNFNFLERLLPKIKEVNELLSQFYQQQKGKLILAFFLSLFHWLMGAVEFYVLLLLLNIKITFWGAILIEVGVACIKSLGAFIPAQIGVEEYGNKVMLGALDLSGGGLWVTVSILRRSRQLIWLMIGGLFFFLVYKRAEDNALKST